MPPPFACLLFACNSQSSAQTSSCSIDANGSIFVSHANNATVLDQHTTTNLTHTLDNSRPVVSATRGSQQRDKHNLSSPNREPPLCCNEEENNRFSGDGGSAGRMDVVLHHAGGVIRCRSTRQLRPSRSTAEERKGSESLSAPNLLAYSTPLLLHSPLFPPKRRTQGRKKSTPAGTTVAAAECAGHEVFATAIPSGRAENGDKVWAWTASTPPESAPFRHRQDGYLHKYMGFEQERLTSLPVEAFRIRGGLKDSSASCTNSGRTDRSAAMAATTQQLQNYVNIRRDQSRERVMTASTTTGSHANASRPVASRSHRVRLEEASNPHHQHPLHVNPFPFELFAEGSNFSPASPPEGVRRNSPDASFPGTSSGSKKRPGTAKHQKAWGAVEQSSRQPKHKSDSNRSSVAENTPKTTSRKSRLATMRYAYPCAFVPYTLERPVSPARTPVFSYTCN